MLRRTDSGLVTVWFATPAPPESAGIALFTSCDERPIAAATELRSVRIGPGLCVSLALARPDEPLPTATTIAYDLTVDGQGLHAMGLLGRHGVNLPGERLPTFKLGSQVFLQGSCRKLHGRGGDASKALDELVAATADSDDRPSAVFLTGDQIYADDVHPLIFNTVRSLGDNLVGPETIPGLPAPLPEQRKRLLRSRAHFTGAPMEHHLATLGEFAAMYVLALDPAAWPDASRHRRLRRAERYVWRLRRALANTPTYMIFDDHDVTDDWNLDQDWRAAVAATAPGRRIIANALAAYWAFQGWGNDPDQFDVTFLSTLRDHFLADERTSAYDTLLLDFDQWDYLTPTSIPAVVLDIRSCRVGNGEALRHIPPPRLDRLRARIAALDPSDSLMLVSPVPLLGLWHFEFLKDWLARMFDLVGKRYSVDAEHFQDRGFHDIVGLFDAVGYRDVVILSGDVHHAYTIEGDLLDDDDDADVLLVQCTSSPMKNRMPPLRGWFTSRWRHEPNRRIRWRVDEIFADGRTLPLGRRTYVYRDNVGYVRYTQDEIEHAIVTRSRRGRENVWRSYTHRHKRS